MIATALTFAIVCYGAALVLSFYRLVVVDDLPDRVLALDTLMVNMIALIVLAGIRSESGLNFHAALLFAMTGFISSVAFCKFLLRGNIIE